MLYHLASDKTLRVVVPDSDRMKLSSRAMVGILEDIWEMPRYMACSADTNGGQACVKTSLDGTRPACPVLHDRLVEQWSPSLHRFLWEVPLIESELTLCSYLSHRRITSMQSCSWTTWLSGQKYSPQRTRPPPPSLSYLWRRSSVAMVYLVNCYRTEDPASCLD